MNDKEIPDTFQYNQQVFSVLSTFLISLMMACLSITVMLFIEKVLSGWQAPYLPVICFLIALERLYTYKASKSLILFSRPWFTMQITQWVVILLVLKLIVLLAKGLGSFWMELQLLALDFQSSFLELDFLIAFVFVVLTWLIAGGFAGLMDEMSLDQAMITFENAVMAASDQPPPRERLLVSIFNIGIVMVILTAFLRIDLRYLIVGQFDKIDVQPLPYLAAGAWNVLLYFLLGLILMSQSQFARLNARWTFRKIPVVRELGTRWALYSVVFIILLAFLASLLPTNYSLGFLSLLQYVIEFIFQFVVFLFGLITGLIMALMNLFYRSGEEPPPILGDSQPPQFEPPPPPEVVAGANVYPWLDVLKSLAFWLVFIAVIGFSLYQFFRQHEGAWEFVRRIPGFKWLANFWHWLAGGFRGLNQHLTAAVDAGLQRLRERRAQQTSLGGRFLNLRRLTPRQRVFYFFFAMTRRGGDHGFPRRGAQTPYEYAATLEDALPDVDEDVASLTDAFVEARYSPRDVEENQAGVVRRYWERIRSALRRR
jgi:hypothetical protein